MSNSRAKGKRGELELSARLRELGFDARRGQQYSGANGDADVIGIDGLHIECKRTEQLRLWEALGQAQRDARAGEIPVVMHRANRRDWVAIMTLDDFAELYRHGWSTWTSD